MQFEDDIPPGEHQPHKLARTFYVRNIATLVGLLALNRRAGEAGWVCAEALGVVDDDEFRAVLDAAMSGHFRRLVPVKGANARRGAFWYRDRHEAAQVDAAHCGRYGKLRLIRGRTTLGGTLGGSMQKAALAMRIAFGILAIVAMAALIGSHGHAGPKGMPIPLERVIVCTVAAAITTFACARIWRSFPAPIVGGIAGAVAAGPYGGLLGFFVRVFVVTILAGQGRSRVHHHTKSVG
jgi:hypothetical protein